MDAKELFLKIGNRALEIQGQEDPTLAGEMPPEPPSIEVQNTAWRLAVVEEMAELHDRIDNIKRGVTYK